jgi:hypothetical protein
MCHETAEEAVKKVGFFMRVASLKRSGKIGEKVMGK